MGRVNFELKDGIHKRFFAQCKEDGRTVSDVVRVLILDWVERRMREKYKLEMSREKDDDGREAETG